MSFFSPWGIILLSSSCFSLDFVICKQKDHHEKQHLDGLFGVFLTKYFSLLPEYNIFTLRPGSPCTLNQSAIKYMYFESYCSVRKQRWLLKQKVFIHIDYSMGSNRGLAYHVVEVTCLECLYLLAAQCLREVILLEAGKHNSHLLKTDITCNTEQSLRILNMTRKCCRKVQLQHHNGQGGLQGPTSNKA